MRRLGWLGIAKLLIRAIGTHSQHQAEIARQLRRLNDTLERIYPPPPASVSADEPPASFEDEVVTLAEAADAEQTLTSELGRTPSVEEILERVAARRERQKTVGDRR